MSKILRDDEMPPFVYIELADKSHFIAEYMFRNPGPDLPVVWELTGLYHFWPAIGPIAEGELPRAVVVTNMGGIVPAINECIVPFSDLHVLIEDAVMAKEMPCPSGPV